MRFRTTASFVAYFFRPCATRNRALLLIATLFIIQLTECRYSIKRVARKSYFVSCAISKKITASRYLALRGGHDSDESHAGIGLALEVNDDAQVIICVGS